MNKYLVYTDNNARIVHAESDALLHGKRVIANPDLSKVVGIPPHYWTPSEDGHPRPMGDDERATRDSHIHLFGVDNQVTRKDIPAAVAATVVEDTPRLSLKNILTWTMLFWLFCVVIYQIGSRFI
jgi:hypothetical protein